jgi:hypothetical protein
MIEYFGLENIVICLVVIVIALIYQLDRLSKHANNHIDKLQTRLDVLEERVGIHDNLGSDPTGFARNDDDGSST